VNFSFVCLFVSLPSSYSSILRSFCFFAFFLLVYSSFRSFLCLLLTRLFFVRFCFFAFFLSVCSSFVLFLCLLLTRLFFVRFCFFAFFLLVYSSFVLFLCLLLLIYSSFVFVSLPSSSYSSILRSFLFLCLLLLTRLFFFRFCFFTFFLLVYSSFGSFLCLLLTRGLAFFRSLFPLLSRFELPAGERNSFRYIDDADAQAVGGRERKSVLMVNYFVFSLCWVDEEESSASVVFSYPFCRRER